MRFLDNVLQDFIDRAPDEMARAKYSAERERTVGLGVMGFHSFLQPQNVPFESAMAKAGTCKMFKHIRAQADQASMMLAKERGPCPDAADMGVMERFQLQDGDRADRVDLDHLRRHSAPASSRSRPTSTPTRRCRAASRSSNPYLEKLLEAKSKDSRQRVELDPRAGRLASSTSTS